MKAFYNFFSGKSSVQCRLFIFSSLFFLSLTTAFSQTTYEWTGSAGTAWNNSANWNPARTTPLPSDLLVFNLGGSITVTNVVAENISGLVITNSSDVNLSGASAVTLSIRNGAATNDLHVNAGSSLTSGTNVSITMLSASNAKVDTGGTFTVSSGRTFLITAYAGTMATIDGTFNLDGILTVSTPALMTINGTMNNTSGSGAITSTAPTIVFSSTAIYDHQRNGGVFPIATWHVDSEARVTGAVNTNITQVNGQTFGKFVWNSPSQTGVVSMTLSGTTTFNNSFTVTSTGSGSMSFGIATNTTNINADLNINNTSTVSMNSGGAVVTTLNLAGNFNLASGATFQRGSATSVQAFNISNVGVNKNFDNAGTYNATGIAFTVNLGAILTLLNNITNQTALFTVSGTLFMSDKVISGTGGTFSLTSANTATLHIGHPGGIATTGSTGNIQVSGTRTYGAAANYVYYQNAQVTGSGLPASISATSFLTFNSDSALTLSNSYTINGTFNYTKGRIYLGNFNLTHVPTAIWNGGAYDQNYMIVTNGTGQLIKQFPATPFAPFVYPVGDTTGVADYSPVMLEFVANASARNLGVRVQDSRHPNDLTSIDYITRNWIFTNTANTGAYTLNGTFTFVNDDVVGTQSNLRVNRYNPITGAQVWNQFNSSIADTVLTMTGITLTDAFFTATPFNFEVTGRGIVPVYYRSKATGNWNDIANWEVSSDPAFISPAAVDAVLIPSASNSDGILISSGHNITVNVATTADDLLVDGTLTIASGITLTVANGLPAFDMIVNGTVINGNAATIGTITPTGAIQFAAGSTYEHAKPGGTVPASTWAPTSTCLITGATGAVPAGLNQTFGNFIWNCAGQTTTLLTGNMTTTGDMTIQNTNSQVLSIIGSTSTATLTVGGNFNMLNGLYYAKTGTSGTVTLNVNGKFNQVGGTFAITNGGTGGMTMTVGDSLKITGGTFDFNISTSTGAPTLNLNGDYFQTGGTFTRSLGTAVCTLNMNGINKTYTQSGGTVTNTYINYAVNAATAVITLNSSITLANSRTFVVIGGGSLYCQDNTISGGTSSVFTLNSGSTLGIGSADGIRLVADGAVGNIRTATRTFNSAANYVYNGTAAQITGSALPATVNALTINNSNGVTLTNSITTVTTALNLTNGLLYLGASNNLSITLATTASINGTFSSSAMVVADGTGQLIKNFAANSLTPFTYPVGDASGPSSTIEYSPVTITFTTNAAVNIGVRVVDDVAPNLGSPTDYLSRHWVFTAGAVAYNYSVAYQYVADDINGDEDNLRLSRFSGGWLSSPSAAASNVLSSIGTLTNSSTPFTTTTIYTGRESAQLYYRSAMNGDYNDVNTWETDIDPAFPAPTYPAAAAPNSTNSVSVFITAGDTVTLSSTTGANIATLLYVDGTLENETTGGTTITTTAGTFFRDGSVYLHNRDGGVIPTAVWHPNSSVNVEGIVNTSATGFNGQVLGHLNWNSTGQTGTVNLASAATTITFAGNVAIASTGSGILSIANAASVTLNIGGAFNQTGGTMYLNNTGTTITTFNLTGNFNQTGGTLQRGSTNTGVQVINFVIGASRTYTQTGTFTTTGINFNVNAGAILILNSGIVVNSGNSFNLLGTGELQMNDNVISGTGAFTIANTAGTILGIGHAQGVSQTGATGNIQTTTRTGFTASTYAVNPTYVFNGTVAQIIGNANLWSQSTLTRLTIDNPVSVTLSQNMTLVTNLNLLQGLFILDNFNLTLSNTSNTTAITGGPFDETTMIVTNGTGTLIKAFTLGAQVPFIYPIGEITGTTEYTPFSLQFTALTTGKNVGVRVVDAVHPAENPTSASYLSRYWAMTTNNSTANTAIGTFYYKDADVIGTEADLLAGQYYGTTTTWSDFGGSVDVTNNIVTSNAITSFFPLATITSPTVDYSARKNEPTYYRSVTNGNWSDLATWEVSTDPTFTSPAPQPAVIAPNATNSEGILITSGDVVTVSASATADNLVVEGTLTVPGSNITLTINNGTGDDLTINSGGELRLQNNGTPGLLTPTSAQIVVNGKIFNAGTMNAVGSIVFNAGSEYEHAKNGGSILDNITVGTSFWNTTSTCRVTGMVAATSLGNISGQSYGNFIWNNTGQTAATVSLAITGSATRFKGNFTLEHTGATPTNSVVMTTTTGITAFIDGDLILNRGSLNLGTGTVSAGLILNLAGNYSQTGSDTRLEATGTFTTMPYINFANNGSGGGKSYTQSAGTVDNTRINYYVNATSTGAILTLNNDINLQATGRLFQVNAGGTLLMGDKLITGIAGTTFTTLTTATLGIGHPDGIRVVADGALGNVRTATRTFSATGTYIYNGTVAQVTGSALPATIGTLVIDNTAGDTLAVSLSAATTLSATGSLTLRNGLLKLGNNNLIISNTTNSTALLGNTPSDSNMVVTNGTGQLIKSFAAGAPSYTPFVYPVGDISGVKQYTPATLTFSAVNTTGNVGARVVNAPHPNIAPSDNHLNRHWIFSTASLSSYTYAASFNFATEDIVGDVDSITGSLYNTAGTNWLGYDSSIADSTLTITTTPLNITSAPLNNNAWTGRESSKTYYYRTASFGNWNSNTTWEISSDNINNWLPAVESPNASNSLGILIRNNHTVTVTEDVDADQMTIDAIDNSTLFVTDSATFTLRDGVGTDLTMSAPSRILVNGKFVNEGSIATSAATTTIFAANSEYEHKQNGGLIPISTWDATATCRITGITTTSPTAMGAPTGGFGHIVYDSPGQTADINLGLGSVTIKGNLTIDTTGTGRLALTNTSAALVVLGNWTMINSNVGIIGYASSTNASSVTLTGNYVQNGGAVSGVLGTGTGVQSILFASGPARTFTQTGTLNTSLINFTVNTGADLTLNNSISLDASGRTFTNNGALYMGANLITGGTGTTFTNFSAVTTTLGIGDPDGIAVAADGAVGNIRTATRTYGVLANYIYNGSVAQNTGSGLSTCNNLTINNSSGVTQKNLANTALGVTVSNLLTLTSGTYDIGGVAGNLNSLVLNGPAIAGTATNLASTIYSDLSFGPNTNANTGLIIPSSISNLNRLTLNIAATNTVTLNSSISLNQATAGVLTLTQGRLILGSHNLTIVSPSYAATTSGGSINAMVVADGSGQLRKRFGTTGFAPYTFPVGDISGAAGNNTGADYSPLAITFTANSTERTIGVSVVDSTHYANGGVTDFASRFWKVSDDSTGVGTYSYNPISLTYSTLPTSDVNGATGNFRINRYNGVGWSQSNSTLSAPTLTSSGALNETTGALGGSEFAIRFNPQSSYEWVATSGSASWTDPASWNPNRFTPQANDILLFNQGGTSTATGIPTETVARILFSDSTSTTFTPIGTNILSIAGITAVNNLAIPDSSTLTLGSGLTLSYSTTAGQLGSIGGTLNVNAGSTFVTTTNTPVVTVGSTGVVNHNGGTFTTSGATFIFGAGSNYNHNITAGTIPTAGWNATSTVNILSPASGTISGTGQAFGHFTVNSSVGVINTIASAMTVNGNLTITSGTFSDNALVVTGNAAGTFTIGANGTYTCLRTATSWMPTNFVTANISFDPLSTFNYNGNATFTIPVAQVNTYGKLAVGVGGTKTLGGAITVHSLEVNAGTLADGAFQITGNSAGTLSVAAGAALQIGAGTATITSFPTNFVTANISLAQTSTVNYTTTTNPQTVSAEPAAYGNLTLTGANVKNVAGNIVVAGNLNIATAGETVNDDGNTITVNGNIANASSTPGHTGSGKIVLSGGTAAHVLSGTGSYTNLELNDSFGATQSASFVINGTLSLTSGNWAIGANILTLNGPAIAQTSGSMSSLTTSNMVFGPNTNSNTGLFIPSSVGVLANLTINIATGNSVTLNGPLNVVASPGITLTQGLLNTTSANLLTVVNTAIGAVASGSATAYINGPMRRYLPPSLASGTYRFPVGKTAYNQLELITPTTSAADTVEVTVEVNMGAPGGANGLVFDITPADRFWDVDITGSGVLTSWGSVRLTQTGISATNRVGYATTQTGQYDQQGGTFVAGPPSTLATTSVLPVSSSSNFFAIGQIGCFNAGTYTVGASGQFARIIDAANMLNTAGICGDVIFELQSDYSGSTETFPITFNQITNFSGTYHITFRPASGVTATTVGAPGSSARFFNFNGTDRITFDGRQGGTGSTSAWTIRNTRNAATFAPTIMIDSGCDDVTMQYLTVESQNTITTSGTIMLGTTGTNNDISILNNTIRDNGTGNPANGFYSSGANNTALTVSSNEFVNHTNSGVLIASAANNATITNNQFYQSITTATAQIPISLGGGNGHTITGNTIGGSATGATGTWTNSGNVVFNGISISTASTGTASVIDNNTIKNISMTGAGAMAFNGINSTAGLHNIGTTSGNIISDISIGSGTGNSSGITSTSSSTVEIKKNIIRDITSTTTGLTRGIFGSAGTFVIQENTVHDITSSSTNTGTGISASVGGIVVSTASVPGQTVNNNEVHSLSNTTSSDNVTVSGIVITTPNVATVTGTLFSSNFSSPSAWTLNTGSGSNTWEIGSAASYPGGSCGAAASNTMYIRCTSFLCDIFGGGAPVYDASNATDQTSVTTNNISTIGHTGINLKFAWRCVGSSGSYGSVRYSIDGGSSWIDLPTQYNFNSGWLCESISLPATCENISNLKIGFRWRNNNSGSDPPFTVANVVVEGQYSVSLDNVVDKNFVHSLNASSTGTAAAINGIDLVGGDNKLYNNMVRLGVDKNGSDITNGITTRGINHSAGASNMYHNSIYIGGSSVDGTGSSYAIYSNSTANRNFINNILVNARSNGSGTGNHRGLRVAGLTDLVSDYNDIYVTGTGGVFGTVNTTNYTFSSDWFIATSQDLHSVSGDPEFVDATGDATDVDLHIVPLIDTPIEGAGTVLSIVADDIDNETRSGLTPSDIGADAGDFGEKDLTPPAIVYTPISTQIICSGNAITTVQISVTDAQSGVSLTSNKPRMYFRRSVGSPTTSWSFANSVEGTYVSGDTITSIWSFTLDHSAFSLTLAQNDEFEYYFVAQDQWSTPNVGVTQTDGSTPLHASVSSLTTAATFAFGANGTYLAQSPLGGTVYVGAGAGTPQYAGFRELGDAIALLGTNDDLLVLVQNDVTETGPATLIENFSCGTDGHTITIQPVDATVRTINGAATGNALTLSGLTNCTIDGRFGGSGRYLRFRSTSTAGAALRLNNGTYSTTVQYCILEASGLGNDVLTLGFSGNAVKDILIDNNDIRNRSDVSQIASNRMYNAIESSGTGISQLNERITISNNLISNFAQSGIIMDDGSYNGPDMIIDGNRFFNPINNSGNYYLVPIYIRPGSSSHSNQITNNIIGGNASDNSGTWTNPVAQPMSGMDIVVGGSNASQATIISGNTIRSINMTASGGGYSAFSGIEINGGRVIVEDNIIGSTTTANSILSNGNGYIWSGSLHFLSYVYGIWDRSADSVVIRNNTVANMTSTAAGGYSNMCGIRAGTREYFWDAGNSLLAPPSGQVIIDSNIVTKLASTSAQSRWIAATESPAHPGGLAGISVMSNATGNVISNNEVYDLFANGAFFRGTVAVGISIDGSGIGGNDATGIISGNKVYDIRNNNAGSAAPLIRPEVLGIAVGTLIASTGGGTTQGRGSYEVVNNSVSLAPTTNNALLVAGIMDQIQSPGVTEYYHNSVYIGGSSTLNGQSNSAAFVHWPNRGNTTTGGNVTLHNNIFMNNRTGVTNSYAISAIINGTPTFSSNNNFLASVDTARTGFWQGTAYDYTGWITNSLSDSLSTHALVANSGNSDAIQVVPSELFVNPANDLHIVLLPPNDPYPWNYIDAKGATTTGVTLDIDADVRSVTAPDLGVDEIDKCLAPTWDVALTDQTGCIDNGVSFVLNVEGTAPFTYQWQESQDTGATWIDLSDTLIYSGTTTDSLYIDSLSLDMDGYLYRLYVYNDCDSVYSDTVELHVLPLPEAFIFSNDTVCYGGNFDINIEGTPDATVTYTVNGGSEQTLVLNDVGSATLNTGALTSSSTYELILVDNGYCTDSISGIITVTVLSPPTVSIASSDTVCYGTDTLVYFTGTPNATVNYNINNGPGQTVLLDGTGNYALATGGLTATTNYYVTAVSFGGCTQSVADTVTFTIVAQPEVNAGSDITVDCSATSVVFNNGAGEDNSASIIWTHDGAGSITNGTTLTPTYTIAPGDTVVTFTLTGNGNTPCASTTDTMILTIETFVFYADTDGDGYGDPGNTTTACTAPSGYVSDNTDFCDSDINLNPMTEWWADNDGDGFGGFIYATGDLGSGCANPMPGDLIFVGGDCNDSNPNVYPGSIELCTNSIDDNCDGVINENCTLAVNDTPGQATVIPLSGNSFPNCGLISGNLSNATNSSESVGYTGNDLWYRFTAVSTGVSITMNGASTDNVLLLYNNSLTLMPGNSTEDVQGTGGSETLNFNGLTIGQQYYISAGSVSGSGGGNMTICLRHLTASTCADGSITYELCSNLKATWTGATNYTYTFTPTGGTGGSVTSITASGQLPMANPTIALRYGGTYTVRIDANYNNLTYGNNLADTPITILGVQTCNITIAPHAELYTKTTQQCPATLLRGSILSSKPYVCAATSFTVSFRKVSGPCTGWTYVDPAAFTVNTTGASPNLYLNFTAPQALTPQSYYEVSWRPNFAYGSGSFGQSNIIFIGGTVMDGMMEIEPLNNFREDDIAIEAALYPNPNMGDMVTLNVSNVKSDDVYVRIFDGMGRVVYTNRFIADGSLVAILNFARPLAGGIYTVELTMDGEVITERMIVTK